VQHQPVLIQRQILRLIARDSTWKCRGKYLTSLVIVSLSPHEALFTLSPCLPTSIMETVVPFIRNFTEANRLLVAVMNKLIFNGLQATSDSKKLAGICLRFTDTSTPLHHSI
jgi:hypothetical protein